MEQPENVTEFRLTAGVAEQRIQQLAQDSFNIGLSGHAKERMAEREIGMPDIYRILRFGSVHDEPELQHGEWKCKVTFKLRGGRIAGAVVALGPTGLITVITVEWEDAS